MRTIAGGRVGGLAAPRACGDENVTRGGVAGGDAEAPDPDAAGPDSRGGAAGPADDPDGDGAGGKPGSDGDDEEPECDIEEPECDIGGGIPGNGDPDPGFTDAATDAVAGPPDAGDACASLAVLGAGSRLSRGIPVSVPVLGRRARPWPLPPSSSSLDGRRTRVVSRTGPGATTPGGSA